MKIQALHKRLSMSLLLTIISATGIGVSFPAQSTSLIGSQGRAIDTNTEATLIVQRYTCPPDPPPSHPCWHQAPMRGSTPEEKPIEKPAIEKPIIEKPIIENRKRYQHQHLPQQQPTGEPSPTIEQLPTVEPSPNN